LRLAFARLAPLDHRGGPRPARFDGLTGTRVPELRQGLHHLLAAQHLAMPAFGSFEKRHTLALHGSRDNGIGPSLARTPHGFEDRGHVVPVDLHCPPAERLKAPSQHSGVVSVWGGSALPETVRIHDHGHTGQALQGGELRCSPRRPFRALAIAEETEYSCLDAVQSIG